MALQKNKGSEYLSVLASKRGQSNIEFLIQLRDLQVYLMDLQEKSPKKFRYLYSHFLIDIAQNAYSNAKCGNSIYMSKDSAQEDYRMRRRFMLNAYCKIQALISQIEVCYAKYKNNIWSNNEFKTLSEKTYTINKLLKGVIDSDKRKYKKLITD